MDTLLGLIVLLMIFASIGISYDKGIKKGKTDQRLHDYEQKSKSKNNRHQEMN